MVGGRREKGIGIGERGGSRGEGGRRLARPLKNGCNVPRRRLNGDGAREGAVLRYAVRVPAPILMEW